MEVPALRRLPELPAGDGGGHADAGPSIDAVRAETRRLRALVHENLDALAREVEARLGPALEGAWRAWERVDDLELVDARLGVRLAQARRTLQAALEAPSPTTRAVAAEGLLVLNAALGLTSLAERRLSSLIRLWVRSGVAGDDLMPGGRPFIDLAPALAEAARGWA